MPGETVLIVDDAPLNRKLAEVVLRKEGFQIQTACDAEEALLLLHAFRPDVLLVDVQLPGMDGLELTRCVKQDPSTRDIVVVALTAGATAGAQEQAFAAGCDGYLTKPVDTHTLGSSIRAFLAKHAEPLGATPAASLLNGVSLNDPEFEGLRRRFLEEGVRETRQFLDSAGPAFDAGKAGKFAHRALGTAGTLGYSEIAGCARAVQAALEQGSGEAEIRETLTDLLYAFRDRAEAAGTVPEWVLRALSGRRLAVVGFATSDSERLCAALERVGARPRAFHPLDPPNCAPVRDCSLVLVQVNEETLNSVWLSADSPAPAGQALVLAGPRERIMSVHPAAQARAQEFLIDGWQPEEALLRCSFALSRAGQPAPATAPPREAAARDGGLPEIVVADDDPVIRSLVRGTLENYGMNCRTAESGTEALEIIKESRPDAAVLDVNMPGLDGYLVLAAMREEGMRTPVILLTARRHENDITRGFTLGADDYVVKPFNNVELVARLRRLLRR